MYYTDDYFIPCQVYKGQTDIAPVKFIIFHMDGCLGCKEAMGMIADRGMPLDPLNIYSGNNQPFSNKMLSMMKFNPKESGVPRIFFKDTQNSMWYIPTDNWDTYLPMALEGYAKISPLQRFWNKIKPAKL